MPLNSKPGGQPPSRLQMMQKTPGPPTRVPVMTDQKPSKTGYSSLTWVLGAAVVCGLLYVGIELTKPTKKSRPKKVTMVKKKKQESNAKGHKQETINLIKPLTTPASNRCEVVINRKPNEDIGIVMCPGEDQKPGAFVAACSTNEKQGLDIGAQLVMINGRGLDSGMSFKDVAQLLSKSCSPTGKLCFKKNSTLGKRWMEAEAIKNNGNALFKKKEIDAAITKYTAAIEKHPTNKVYYSNKVKALYSKAKRNPDGATEIYTEALSHCQTMEELDVLQNFKLVHHLRGVIMFELGRHEEAKKAFQAFLQIDTGNKSVLARLAECDKAISAATAAEVAKEKESNTAAGNEAKEDGEEVVSLTYVTDGLTKIDKDAAKSPSVKKHQNESPSPVLVEKPCPTEITEVEPLGGNEQQETKNKEVPVKVVIDETSVAAPEPIEGKTENTAKCSDEGANGGIVVQKD